MLKNKEMIEEDEEDEKYSVKNQLRTSGYFRINSHSKKHIGIMSCMSKDQFKIREINLVLPGIKKMFRMLIREKMNQNFIDNLEAN
tara:strand:- start:3230 stop:3487 length:258 start_codon:yes stop_codon:yes gene_type:complete